MTRRAAFFREEHEEDGDIGRSDWAEAPVNTRVIAAAVHRIRILTPDLSLPCVAAYCPPA